MGGLHALVLALPSSADALASVPAMAALALAEVCRGNGANQTAAAGCCRR